MKTLNYLVLFCSTSMAIGFFASGLYSMALPWTITTILITERILATEREKKVLQTIKKAIDNYRNELNENNKVESENPPWCKAKGFSCHHQNCMIGKVCSLEDFEQREILENGIGDDFPEDEFI